MKEASVRLIQCVALEQGTENPQSSSVTNNRGHQDSPCKCAKASSAEHRLKTRHVSVNLPSVNKGWKMSLKKKTQQQNFLFLRSEREALPLTAWLKSTCDFAYACNRHNAVSAIIQAGCKNGEVIIPLSRSGLLGFSRAWRGQALIMIISYSGSLFFCANPAKYGLWQSYRWSFANALKRLNRSLSFTFQKHVKRPYLKSGSKLTMSINY